MKHDEGRAHALLIAIWFSSGCARSCGNADGRMAAKVSLDASGPTLTGEALQFIRDLRGYPGLLPTTDVTVTFPHTHASMTKVGPGSYGGLPPKPAYDALVMNVIVTNVGSAPAHATFAHEWYGGEWPSTDMYACAMRLAPPAKWEVDARCQPLFVAPERYETTPKSTLEAGASVSLAARWDWAGTGSVHGAALIRPDEPGRYLVQAIVITETASGWRYAMSDVTSVVVER